MKMLDRKGFTLVELLAVIILLAIVMGISSYAIIDIINVSREKDYSIVIDEINNAVEQCYIECIDPPKDSAGNLLINCPVKDINGYYNINLGFLVSNGFLKGNGTDNNGNFILVNPRKKGNPNIMECDIRYKYSGGKVLVEAIDSDPVGPCPTSY